MHTHNVRKTGFYPLPTTVRFATPLSKRAVRTPITYVSVLCIVHVVLHNNSSVMNAPQRTGSPWWFLVETVNLARLVLVQVQVVGCV